MHGSEVELGAAVTGTCLQGVQMKTPTVLRRPKNTLFGSMHMPAGTMQAASGDPSETPVRCACHANPAVEVF